MNPRKLRKMRRYGNQWKKKSFEQHFLLPIPPRNMGIQMESHGLPREPLLRTTAVGVG
jgi:hypothetical protein